MRRTAFMFGALGLPFLMGAEASGCQGGTQPPDAGMAPDDAGPAIVEFTDTFKREASGSCSSADYPVIGYAPAPTGTKYPLLIYSVGTWDNYQSVTTRAILREAAARGFVAVSASYDTNFVFG